MTRKGDIIDNIFRDSLNGYMEEIPSANIWNNISRKLLMKDILKFSFMRLGVLVIFLLASLYFIIPLNLIKTSSSDKALTSQASNSNIINKTVLSQNIHEDVESSDANINRKKLYKFQAEKIIPSIVKKQNIKKENQLIVQSKENSIPSTNQYNSDLAFKTSISSQFIRKPDKNESPSSIADISKDEITNLSLISPKDFKLDLQQYNNNLVSGTDNITNISNIYQIPEKFPMPEVFNNSPFEPNKPEFSIDIWGSPLWIKKSITAKEKLYTDHITKRIATEKPLLNYSFGMDLKMNYNNWLLITGLNYSEYSENADYSLFSKNIDSSYFITYQDASYWEYDTLAILYNPVDSSIVEIIYERTYILDSVAFTNTDYDTTFANTNYSFLNTYKWIEIPLLVGREFSKERFTFSVATGVSYGFLTGTTGSILHYDNNSIIVIDKNKAPFKNSMFNYILQVGVDYTITKKIGVVCKPMFRYNLNSMFDKSYPVDQRYYSFGVNCGLRYKF